MNRRILVPSISFAGLIVCLVCATCLMLYYGISFDGGPFSSEFRAQLSIRFQGGTRIVLEPNIAQGTTASLEDMQNAKAIISNRLHALGIDSVIQIRDNRRLTIDLPGKVDTSRIISVIPMGVLEFVDAGDTPLQIGQAIQTTGVSISSASGGMPSATVYRTIMTGKYIRSASVEFQQGPNQPYIYFTLNDDGKKIFADFTRQNIQKYLAIVIDKKVIMSPIIKSAITGGSGIIENPQFTLEEANLLLIQLKYGALPFPLKVVETTIISQ